jgi:hypothetical protein
MMAYKVIEVDFNSYSKLKDHGCMRAAKSLQIELRYSQKNNGHNLIPEGTVDLTSKLAALMCRAYDSNLNGIKTYQDPHVLRESQERNFSLFEAQYRVNPKGVDIAKATFKLETKDNLKALLCMDLDQEHRRGLIHTLAYWWPEIESIVANEEGIPEILTVSYPRGGGINKKGLNYLIELCSKNFKLTGKPII